MGGSAKYTPPPTREEMESLRRSAVDEAQRQVTVAAINAYLVGLLAEVNERDTAGHREKVAALLERIRQLVDETEQLLFGGSVAKHTYVDGLSDVDCLVILDAERWGEVAPSELLASFQDALTRRLPQGEISSIERGLMAITVTFRDGDVIQLLPALRRGDRVAVSPDGASWRDIDPKAFAARLTAVNQANRRIVVPTIKLAKSIIASALPEELRLSGYHVEALAVAAFSSYSGATNLADSTTHLFRFAADAVTRPIRDVTGQTAAVDEYLGPANSESRRQLASILNRLAARMASSTAVEQWREIVGDE